jgi:hypothetical protein
MTTDYRIMRRKKLFDIETALLPQTMQLAELTVKKKSLENRAQEILEEIRKLYAQRNDVSQEIQYCDNMLQTKGKNAGYKPDTVSGCPKEGCRGFISKKKWSCGLCDTCVCDKCFEILLPSTEGEASASNTHVCKQENIDTTKMIMKECKPCPKCSAQISKIDGCDQMFCVQCNTAFSWVTGKIETGKIHNPHYYDWMRQTNNGIVPRDPDDGACENNELVAEGYLFFRLRNRNYPEKINERIWALYQRQVHIRFVILQNLLEIDDNTQLRIDYLLNRIDRDEFEKEIEKKHRVEMKKKAIANCLDLYLSIMIDNFYTFYNELSFKDEDSKIRSLSFGHLQELSEKLFDEEAKIRAFTNENLQKLSDKLNFSPKKYLIGQ